MRLILATILCAAFQVVTSAAPVPKDAAKPKLYFPTQKGAAWVYTSGRKNEGLLDELKLVVTAAEEVGGATHLTLSKVQEFGKKPGPRQPIFRLPMPRVDPYQKLAVSPKGVFLLEEDEFPFDAPYCLLKLPPAPGTVWESGPCTFMEVTVKMKGKFVAHAPEEVEVPAGKFAAVRVEASFELPKNRGPGAPETTWFSPGVGIIKFKHHGGQWLLKSYTPGDGRP